MTVTFHSCIVNSPDQALSINVPGELLLLHRPLLDKLKPTSERTDHTKF